MKLIDYQERKWRYINPPISTSLIGRRCEYRGNIDLFIKKKSGIFVDNPSWQGGEDGYFNTLVLWNDGSMVGGLPLDDFRVIEDGNKP